MRLGDCPAAAPRPLPLCACPPSSRRATCRQIAPIGAYTSETPLVHRPEAVALGRQADAGSLVIAFGKAVSSSSGGTLGKEELAEGGHQRTWVGLHLHQYTQHAWDRCKQGRCERNERETDWVDGVNSVWRSLCIIVPISNAPP